MPGFDTDGCNDFTGYINPDLPPNGGSSVSDGEFNMNYIRTYTPLRNNTTDVIPIHGQIDYSQWSESITYFDGLGREIQKVDVKASAAGFDIIQPFIYVSILPTTSCPRYPASLVLAHEKESEVQQGEYFSNNSRLGTKQAIAS